MLRRTVLSAAVAACLVILGSFAADAAGTSTIRGMVYDALTNAPIAGAKLSLSQGPSVFSTVSDRYGAFAFSDLAAGTWSLRTTASLYQLNVSQAIAVAAGQTVTVGVAMQPVTSTSITTIGHVTVSGQRTLNTTSAAVTTISSNAYVTAGAPQIQQLLETTPGISIEHFDNGAPGNVATFTIRGAGGFVGGSNTGYEVLVLQDGEPMRNGQYGDDDLSGLTPAIYSRVEVVKGVGGTSLFGANTIGGTLNLVTIDPKATEGGELLTTFGGFGTTSYDLTQTNTYNRLGYIVEDHEYSTDGFIPTNLLVDNPPFTFSPSATKPPIGDILHPTNAMILHSVLGKFRYDTSKSSYAVLTFTDESDWRDQFGLLANPETVFLLSNFTSYSNDPKGYPYFFGFPMNYVWNTDPKYSLDFHTALAGGSLVVRYYDNWINRWVDGNNAPAESCCFLQKSIDHLSGELVTWDKVFGNNDVALALGGNGDAFQYGSSFKFDTVVKASDITPTIGTQIERTALIRDDDEISSKFDATFAGYYSNYNDLNVRRFDPRFGLVNRPDQNTAIRFSAGSGFAAPRLSDIVTPLDLNAFDSVSGPNCPSGEQFCNATSGNPNIKEETAFGYDLGYERTWGSVGDFSVDLYRTLLHNHIFTAILPAPAGLTFSDSTPVLGISEPINIAGSVYQGIELAGALPVARDYSIKAYYDTQGAYPTNVDPLLEANIGDVVNQQQYLGVPLHKIGWSANFANPERVSAFIGADWFGPNNSYNVPQFWVYNAGLSAPLNDSSSLHLSWRNIFNKDALVFSNFDGGVPYPAAPGYFQCSGTPCTYPTTAFSYMPHVFSVTFDERIGSLR